MDYKNSIWFYLQQPFTGIIYSLWWVKQICSGKCKSGLKKKLSDYKNGKTIIFWEVCGVFITGSVFKNEFKSNICHKLNLTGEKGKTSQGCLIFQWFPKMWSQMPVNFDFCAIQSRGVFTAQESIHALPTTCSGND